MKTFRNIALIILIIATITIVGLCTYYKYMISPISNQEEIVSFEIPANSSRTTIAKILEEKGLIRDDRFFVFYIQLYKISNMKAGYYNLSKNLSTEEIIRALQKGTTLNPNEIQVTFKEGITMREVARIISENTENEEEAVLAKTKDTDYLQSLIERYWFLSEDILQEELYYGLEGYLFPDTYNLTNSSVSIEYIFDKMLNRMDEMLSPYREDIEKSGYSVHQILTMASMVEKESAGQNQRDHVASVFYNRLKKGMSLGSDVTTRYALKIDDNKQPLSSAQFETKSPYNTRLTDGSMNGKLPVGPISTVGLSSIQAAIYPMESEDLYFIANIQTLETFFYSNYNDFQNKKNELASVNGGL